ncbi:hypothetical protein DFS33DRAFT_611684 [Desarmillaria ectypa]|nr:hypothetical protein DFS33DRAFT_611684 [Desarmillaria ectypa]
MGGRRFEDVVNSDSGSGSEVEYTDATRALDWQRIGRRALAKSRRVPAPSSMLGPLSIEVKKRPVKRARFEKNKEDLRRPQKLKGADIVRSDKETTKNVILAASAFHLKSILAISVIRENVRQKHLPPVIPDS